MLLSISSSDSNHTHRHWIIVLVIAAISSAALVTVAERYWRQEGYSPLLIDSPQLWSVQRSRANDDRALVFVGASRTQFGIHPKTVERLLPGSEPVILAINGRYPLATLQHLAEDDDFNGTVLLDVDARGLMIDNHGAQKEFTDYYDSQWNPNWHLHRLLLNSWQKHMALARPALGVAPTLVRIIEDKAQPFRPYTRLSPDRSGFIDFNQVNPADLAKHFAHGLQEDIGQHPPPPPATWLAELENFRTWHQAIEQRGGRVILYEPPVSGQQQSLAQAAYPKELYWDQLVKSHNLRALNYQDEPDLQVFGLPDESHVNGLERAAYTEALIKVLLRKGYISNTSDVALEK